MLTIYGTKSNRREFLRVGALGSIGLTLADVLRLRARANPAAKTSSKSVIMIYLFGGPSHIDMYDLKPDAPVEIRGEFKPIRTNVPSMDICELMPLQAKIADKWAVVRSMKFRDPFHVLTEVTTGYYPLPGEFRHPSFGSIISHLRGWSNGAPPNVAMLHRLLAPQVPTLGFGWEYLGPAHRPFEPDSQVGNNLRPLGDVTLEQLDDRGKLLSAFDTLHRQLDHQDRLSAADAFTRQAREMLVNGKVREALDLNREPEPVRQRYNVHTAGRERGLDGRSLLLARRLVEAGVSVVSLMYGIHWDTHIANTQVLRGTLPSFDQGIAALIGDLYDRGLDKDVAVVVWGEMGRSPHKQGDSGRDHWPQAGFALLSGGGFRTGQAIGSTDAHGGHPKSNQYTPQNVFATLYRHLGIDLETTLTDPNGRPHYLLDDREPIKELL